MLPGSGRAFVVLRATSVVLAIAAASAGPRTAAPN